MSIRKDFFFNISETMKVKDAYPPKNDQNLQKYVPHYTNVSLSPRSFFTLISQSESCDTYFVKWSTSGEPLVGFKSHQDSRTLFRSVL